MVPQQSAVEMQEGLEGWKCTTISRESEHTFFFFNSTRELLLGIIKIFFKPFLAKIRIYGKLCCELIKASNQFVQIITSILVVIRLCPETRSKSRSYVIGEGSDVQTREKNWDDPFM